jgi:DNA-binding MarR family transcriptional regulator
MPTPTSSPILIEKFWESIPPAWRQTRNQIRRIAVERFQMTEEQFQVLRRIRKGNTSVSALAETGQTSRSAVSRTVDALVQKNLISRQQDPSDRRKIPLALTDEGQRAMSCIYDQTEQWLSARFARLTAEETKSFLQGMESLRKIFSSP